MEVLGQKIKGEELIYGIGDIIAAHHLLHYVKDVRGETRVRMASAAVLGGLGYCFGPDLAERLRDFRTKELDAGVKKQLMYAATGTLLGALVGYSLTKDKVAIPVPIQEVVDQAVVDAQDPAQPGPLLTMMSVGWLGYSLLRTHDTKEDRDRHLWGFGGALLGYTYGPETLRHVKQMLVPKDTQQKVLGIYGNGSVVVGAMTGGILGWTNGEMITGMLR